MIIYFCFEREEESDKFWIWEVTGSGKEIIMGNVRNLEMRFPYSHPG